MYDIYINKSNLILLDKDTYFKFNLSSRSLCSQSECDFHKLHRNMSCNVHALLTYSGIYDRLIDPNNPSYKYCSYRRLGQSLYVGRLFQHNLTKNSILKLSAL